MRSSALGLAVFMAACGGGFDFPEFLEDWNLATQTTSGCTNPQDNQTKTFQQCVEGSTDVPCKRLNPHDDGTIGVAIISDNGSAFGTIVPYTIDETMVTFLDDTYTWSAGATLRLTNTAADANGCTVVEVFNPRQ